MNMPSIAGWIVRLRWFWIVVVLLTTGFFALQLPKVQMDTELKNQLPPHLATRLNLAKIEGLFGGTDMIMLVVSADDVLAPAALDRIKRLSDGMAEVDGLQRLLGPLSAKTLRGEDGEMIVEPAIPGPPKDATEREALVRSLESNPLVYGNLISKDFKHAVIIGFLAPSASDEFIVASLEALVEKEKGPEEVLVGGMPVTRVALTKDMRRDMRRFLPIGLVVMLVFLVACFRQLRSVVLPFVMTVFAIIVAMGLIPLLGWKIYTVTILLPVILLAVANDYGIHWMARYEEETEHEDGRTPLELARGGILELTAPVLATGSTTAVGLLCLRTHLIVPAQQLGVLGAVGVAFAMFGTIVFMPAIISLLPRPKPLASKGQRRAAVKTLWLDSMLAYFGAMVARHPKPILWVSAVVSLVMGLGVARMVVDTNPMSFYQRDEPIWRSTHVLNEDLGGWAGFSVIAEGDIQDPKVLHAIDDLEQHLRKHPSVGTTSSIATVIRQMNKAINDGDPAHDRIPDSREMVAQLLLLYSMSGEPADLEKLADLEFKHAQVMVKVTESGTAAASEVVAYTHAYLEAKKGGPLTLVGGLLDVMAEMVHHIVWGQITSTFWATLFVCALVGLFMKSVVAGFLSTVPLAIALTMIYGVMGYGGIELNLITALLSTIMLGVGIDYSIHFLWRYRDERFKGLDVQPAIEKTLVTTGRGIVFNGLSVVVGFAVLIVSAFFPVRFFGLLVAISILASMIGALVVLPALLIVVRPRFLEPKNPT